MMDCSRSVSSRRTHRSTGTRTRNRSRSRSRSRLFARNSSSALVHGLDELDLRVATVNADKCNDAGRRSSVVGDSSCVSIASHKSLHSSDTTFLITNIVQMNLDRKDSSSCTGHHRRLSSGKSVSGKSIRSTMSSQEIREAQIARTVLRQAKESSSMRNKNDHDGASVVTTHEILGDLTDNEDCKSVRSILSRGSRRSTRSKSTTRHRKCLSSISLSERDESVSVGRERSKTVSLRSSRIKVSSESGNEGESERLYNAFMKNLSRQERIAHDTKVLSTASNIRAAINAEQMGRKSGQLVHDKAKSKQNWAIDLFEPQNVDSFPFGDDETFAAKSLPSSRSKVNKSILSTLSSAPKIFSSPTANSEDFFRDGFRNESLQIESFNPRDNFMPDAFVSASPQSPSVPASRSKTSMKKALSTKSTSLILHEALDAGESSNRSETNGNTASFADFGVGESQFTAARYTFSETSELKLTQKKKKQLMNSPARDDVIAPARRSIPKTSKNSFVPSIPSKPLVGPAIKEWDEFNPSPLEKDRQRNHQQCEGEIEIGKFDDTGESEFTGSNFIDPFGINCHEKCSSSLDYCSQPRSDFHKKGLSQGFRDNFHAEMSPPLCEQGNGDVNGFGFENSAWRGFDKSRTFESIPSGWETEEESDDELEGAENSTCPKTNIISRSSCQVNSSMKSTWSDTSPAGVADFDSLSEAWLKKEDMTKLSKTNLFSANGEQNSHLW